MITEDQAATGDSVELLRQLIRNACVNDGTPSSGQEIHSADLIEGYLLGSGLDVQCYEPTPGRRSLVARIEGSDPAAPSLLLMGHTDVVPVSPEGWRRDPFGGELVDGEIWGRGALDMLYITATMAVGTRRLAAGGWRPRGTLVYLAVADEEAGGHHGADWLVTHEREAVAADYVVTESGGWQVDGPSGRRVVLTVGEKGSGWRRLRVKGTPGHGSMPFGSDNALVAAGEVVRRLSTYRPLAQLDDVWRAYVASLELDPDLRAALLDPERVWWACEQLAATDPPLARYAHACTHMTVSPNVVHGGTKTNVIPDEVVLDVDIRTLPGQTPDDVDALLVDALGPLVDRVDIKRAQDRAATSSPLDTPLYASLERVARHFEPEATLLPRVTAGGTDATFFRDVGSIAYGFAMLSAGVTFSEWSSRFHGRNERIDVESVARSTEAWDLLCRDVLG